jgi:tetratricopeptide (TPR) repeat protein
MPSHVWPTTRVLTLVAVMALGVALPGRAAPARDAQVRADSLHRRALERLADDTIESRRAAIRDLEQASILAPDRVEVWRDLARLCQLIGDRQRARSCLQRIAVLAPDDGDAQSALGLGWKWEWLATAEDSAYSNAVRCLLRAAALAPKDLEARLALTALALARGNAKLASMAARSAIACDRQAAEAQIAFACAAYWEGDLPLAEAAFREAIPRLPPGVGRRFADLSPIGHAEVSAENPPQDSAAASTADFWREQDPDLTTSENEVELNFMARVANALLLFRDARGVRWDMRVELFVRYGAPEAIDPPPPDAELKFHFPRHGIAAYAPAPLEFPYHMQTWSYPGLGMRVELWDRSLSQAYEIPYSDQPGREPRPDPALIAGRSDLVVLGNGRGVYRGLPPGISPMTARGKLSQFPGPSGTRLVAHLEAPGGPTDSLWGRWVVIARDGREVARGAGALSISACEPTERQVAQFTASVPPGEYRVDLAVTDGERRRGVVHLSERVVARSDSLVMSDIVLLCGERARIAGGGPVLIEPNLEHRLRAAREVSVYFELDGLVVGEDGRATFGYAYAIRPVGGRAWSRRPAEPVFQASREETNVGGHRRQFVSALIASLAPGSYDLEITVRDLRSGAAATRAVRFERE